MKFLFIMLLCGSLIGADYGCPKPIIIQPENESWTGRDEGAYEKAVERCGKIYANSPCLITFEKVTAGQYRAICGQKRPTQK